MDEAGFYPALPLFAMKDFVFGVIVDLNGFKASFSIDDLVSIGAFALVAVGLKGINLNHLNFLIML